MLSTFDLGHYLTYPFKDRTAQKNFLLGSLVILAGLIIPFVPYFILFGYLAKIMRQVMNGEKASMPAWENWETLLADGLRFYGIRLLFSLPFMVLLFGAMAIYFVGMFVFVSQDPPSTGLLAALMLFFMCTMGLMFPLGIGLSLLTYPAGSHVVATQKFSAGLNWGEWWPILRKNLGGVAIVIGMMYVTTFAVTVVYQVMYFTIILICLLPIFLPMGSFYMLLVSEAMAAQAYREGREKLISN